MMKIKLKIDNNFESKKIEVRLNEINESCWLKKMKRDLGRILRLLIEGKGGEEWLDIFFLCIRRTS